MVRFSHPRAPQRQHAINYIYRAAAIVWPHLPLLEGDSSVSQRGVLDAEVGVLLEQAGRRCARPFEGSCFTTRQDTKTRGSLELIPFTTCSCTTSACDGSKRHENNATRASCRRLASPTRREILTPGASFDGGAVLSELKNIVSTGRAKKQRLRSRHRSAAPTRYSSGVEGYL